MRIGDVTVHSLLDGVIPVPPAVLYPDVPQSSWQQIPAALNPDGMLDLSFGSFLASDSHGNRVLFDLGGGPAPDLLGNGVLPPLFDLMPDALKALGCPLESVTDVVLSHLHIDHVGWAAVDDAPTFPGARHHVHTGDWEHFVERGADEPVQRKVGPLREVARLWDGDQTEPFEWLRLFHAPGHTPGSSVAVIESGGQGLALIGDLVHIPAALEHPHWRCGFDIDPEAAAARRADWISRLRKAGFGIASPHFPDLLPIAL